MRSAVACPQWQRNLGLWAMGTMSLNACTLDLLKSRSVNLTYERIAAECGVIDGEKVTVHWLKQYACQKIAHPSVGRVQAVYEYLSGASILNHGV